MSGLSRRDFLLASSSALIASSYDVVVYGGTSAGVIAAVQAARLGKSVALIEPRRHLGGMTTGGLGLTDKGDASSIGGLAIEFYRRMGRHYGSSEPAWRHEPHVASMIYRQMLDEAKPGKITTVFQDRLDLGKGVRKQGSRIVEIVTEKGNRYAGKMFLDTSYEGDLMAKAGVSYTVGRESRAQYGESLAGVIYPGVPVVQRKQFFPKEVSAYDAKGRLLPGIYPGGLGEIGSGDRKIQAYNIRLCLSTSPENRLPIIKPDSYDPMRYELLARWILNTPRATLNGRGNVHYQLLPASPMPNDKTDVNDGNPAGTDYINASWDYPDGDYATRDRVWKDHEDYTRGYLWFLLTDPRVPEPIRLAMAKYGLPKDEYTDNGNWTHQIYIREGRRMRGEYVLTQRDCRDEPAHRDSVGVATYPADSHHVQRVLLKEGQIANEGNFNNLSWPIFPHEVPYRSLIPRRSECTNLLVPVCLSISHVANGSVRMEPVFMILAQSAAAAAALAIDGHADVQAVDYSRLRAQLLKDGQILSRELTDSFHHPRQKVAQ